jgi:hypothetical protein
MLNIHEVNTNEANKFKWATEFLDSCLKFCFGISEPKSSITDRSRLLFTLTTAKELVFAESEADEDGLEQMRKKGLDVLEKLGRCENKERRGRRKKEWGCRRGMKL